MARKGSNIYKRKDGRYEGRQADQYLYCIKNRRPVIGSSAADVCHNLKSRQFCRDYFVVYFDVNILFLFLILDFCFYLIFHKSSKYKGLS